MELRVLNYFLMVAREENITKAAALLHITQPTLSRQLMQLEEELGVQLFRRGRHNIILTEDGLLLKRRAQELVSLAEKTKQDFAQEEAVTGTVSIGSGELKGMGVLAEIMTSFRQSYPGVRFELYSGNADDIKERIEGGLLDMGLLLEPVEIGKYDFIRTNTKEEWYALVSETSPLAQKDVLVPQDFEGMPLYITRRTLVRGRIFDWLGEYADESNIIASGNLLYNLAMFVRSSQGAVITIRLDCHYDGMKYIPLSPKLTSDTLLVWKKTQAFSRATEAFIRHAQEMLKQHF